MFGDLSFVFQIWLSELMLIGKKRNGWCQLFWIYFYPSGSILCPEIYTALCPRTMLSCISYSLASCWFQPIGTTRRKRVRRKVSGTDFCHTWALFLPTHDFDSGYVALCVSTTIGQPIFHSHSHHWVLILPLSTLTPVDIGVVMAFHCHGPLNAPLSLFAVS